MAVWRVWMMAEARVGRSGDLMVGLLVGWKVASLDGEKESWMAASSVVRMDGKTETLTVASKAQNEVDKMAAWMVER